MKKIRKKILIIGALSISMLILNNMLVDAQNALGPKIKFIDYFYENASQLLWARAGDDSVKIFLPADYERESLNCQTDHWNFKLYAEPGTRVNLVISKMTPDVYNGRKAVAWWKFKNPISLYISYDQKEWIALSTSTTRSFDLTVNFVMKGDMVQIARIPPYTTANLEILKNMILPEKTARVFNIGTTVEGRPLEIIQLGNSNARHSVIIRARSHPWEDGGSWVVDGLVRAYLSEWNRIWANELCVYIMPMANKDGVVRGMTRFNVAGKDINRNMDKKADPLLCPENFALENFICALIAEGKKPSLGIDLHNDDYGGLHLAHHERNDSSFMKNIKTFEGLMKKYTSYAENTRYAWRVQGQAIFPVTFSDGMLLRYGIESLVYELNANWFAGLNKIPEIDDYMNIGKNLNRVLYEYLKGIK
jgi:hypothetical protein